MKNTEVTSFEVKMNELWKPAVYRDFMVIWIVSNLKPHF
jgi:hypothetical protein